jgi:hypothetical protein
MPDRRPHWPQTNGFGVGIAGRRPSFFLAPSRRGEAELFNKQPIRRLGEDEGFLLPT